MKTNTDLNRLFEEIYPACYDTVFGFLMRLTDGDYDLSEELTQETFLQAWISIERFRGKCAFSTWLCQISKNCWLKYLRKHKNAPLPMDLESLSALPLSEISVSQSDQPEEAAIGQERRTALRGALLALPPKQRDIVIYRLFYDLSYEEIERLTGIKKATARVLYQRSRAGLAKSIQKSIHMK